MFKSRKLFKTFSKQKNIPMTNISFGQGQGIIAKNAILFPKENGGGYVLGTVIQENYACRF